MKTKSKTLVSRMRWVALAVFLWLGMGACYEINYFVADQDIVLAGASVTLRWSSDDFYSCSINNNVGSVPGTGSVVVTPQATTTYILNCSDSTDSDFASVLVLVVPNPTPWNEEAPMTSPAARSDHAMAFDGEKVIVFGGWDGADYLGDTWSWDGSNWVAESPMTSPPARAGHVMARIPTGVILFGGEDEGGALDDTWLWDGDEWEQISPPNAPAPRYGHAIGSDGSRVILFGGTDGTQVFGDTWRWTGLTWQRVAGLAPSARVDAQVAFDPQNTRIHLVGGRAGANVLADRWELTDFGWRLTSLTPAVRVADGAVVSDGRALLIVGGFDGTALSGDTVLGSTGLYRAIPGTIPSPPARRASAAARDPLLDEVVLFGGEGPSGELADTWIWTP